MTEPAPQLHPLLASRRSRRAFDPDAEVTDAELAVLLEAARWTPSSFNLQPWRFVVGRRDTPLGKRILAHVRPHNQRWAARAPVLLVGAHLVSSLPGWQPPPGELPPNVTLPPGRELRFAEHDLGQAMAYLTVQATALELCVHQMAGFDPAGLHADLGMPAEVTAKVVAAVGRIREPASLPPDLAARETAPRERHPVSALLLPVDPPADLHS